ncbi:Deoxyribose-phosphate aldolase 1 [Candidatus Ornithobacterium hominis]|uniref:deoxyribose-phosphate aldolase n=1 Tax=Candidatus Ornithobacterium hominis TaxID=2497989 RepID=UPI000E5B8668|nr:deoxyribose-phosphate aldolase [Candidatus Ornithobacterium hominis]SZD71791.1 Deoxyribose-phosphate aldolase 1 [Candidatus Ornithobacterium hominis]
MKEYLDSTYLKTPEQSDLSVQETEQRVVDLVQEAIENGFKAVMIRPGYVKLAKKIVDKAQSRVKVGTVIGFHEGINTIKEKIQEAERAIDDGADELDFVLNFQQLKNGNLDFVKEEVKTGNDLVLNKGRVIKWIIETAALTDEQIAEASELIREVTLEYLPSKTDEVFVKSSTGFYTTKDGSPNGATPHAIEIMLKHAHPLPVKAAGGIRNAEEAKKLIRMGVKRLGTSSAKEIVEGNEAEGY